MNMKLTAAPALSFYPIVLEGDDWSLKVQQTPNPRIFRTGRMPEPGEVLNCAASIQSCPAWLVSVLMVMLQVAEVEDFSTNAPFDKGD